MAFLVVGRVILVGATLGTYAYWGLRYVDVMFGTELGGAWWVELVMACVVLTVLSGPALAVGFEWGLDCLRIPSIVLLGVGLAALLRLVVWRFDARLDGLVVQLSVVLWAAWLWKVLVAPRVMSEKGDA
jgi:hypothetical protein